MKPTTHKQTLNQKQIRLLKLIYKFRYITSIQISKYELLTSRAINYRLEVLADQGYIGIFFDKSYKLSGKPARYYLTLKGINFLKTEPGINLHSLKLMYKNKSISSVSINHHLLILDIYIKLRTKFKDGYLMYGKYEIYGNEIYPNPPTDIYIQKIESIQNACSDYLIDIFEDTPPFVIKKRLKAIMEHLESEEYQQATKRAYPSILIICADEKIEKRLMKPIEHVYDSTLKFSQPLLTTTLKRFNEAKSVDEVVWTNALKPEKIITI